MKALKYIILVLSVGALITIIAYAFSEKVEPQTPVTSTPPPSSTPVATEEPDDSAPEVSPSGSDSTTPPEDTNVINEEDDQNVSENDPDFGESIEVITDVENVAVIVNPEYALPENYEPKDLVYPDVRFIFDEKIEKRMLRKVAAEALEQLFAAAEDDGIYLAGVSAYRSHATQKSLFNRYVERDGYDKAKTYSAVPGTSEHETGLAIDVTSSDGKCAAQDCFGGTKEAIWIAEHAADYGFIVRYPEGKEEITGYKYEPWHLRYVGVEMAQELHSDGITLEEYYNVVPVKQ